LLTGRAEHRVTPVSFSGLAWTDPYELPCENFDLQSQMSQMACNAPCR